MSVAVALEQSTMESIRSIQHRDANGDIIGSNRVICKGGGDF